MYTYHIHYLPENNYLSLTSHFRRIGKSFLDVSNYIGHACLFIISIILSTLRVHVAAIEDSVPSSICASGIRQRFFVSLVCPLISPKGSNSLPPALSSCQMPVAPSQAMVVEPTEGRIWKAGGLAAAHVAQHAFHHSQKHKQETATQHIMWRFAGNADT